MNKPKLNPLIALIGLPFWGLLAAAIITKDTAFITAFLVVLVLLVATLLTVKIRASNRKTRDQIRVWRDGQAGTARIISIDQDGSGINDHLNIDFVLEVKVSNKEPYQAKARILISQLAIPRIQPDCEVEVRVDREDPMNVLVDPALTPYQHYGPKNPQAET